MRTETKQSKTIDKALNKMLITSIVASIAFVVGIPLIIYGATNSLWIFLGLGIAFVVFGFYGAPVLWTSYGTLKTQKRVVDAVMEEHLTSVSEIASQLQLSERTTKDYIRKAINKKYITGFIYDGNTLVPNEKQAPKKKMSQNRCPSCGGVMEKTDTGWICPYCGSKFENV